MIAIFSGYILLSCFLAIKKPTYFIIWYLFSTTKFLGFFDLEYYFVIAGLGLGIPVLNLISFAFAFYAKKLYKTPKKIIQIIAPFLVFLSYGIIRPILLEFENTQQAIIASKEFWCISILIYLFLRRREINNRLIIKYLKIIGLYLAIMYSTFLLLNIGPPFYLQENFVRGFFPTFISLAFFLFYVDFQNGKIKNLHFFYLSVILFSGLILCGHFSLFIGTFFACLILFVFYKKNKFIVQHTVSKSFFIIVTLCFIFLFLPQIRETSINLVHGIIEGTDTGLISRDIYNSFRWDAIDKQYFFGYGFIHKSSPLSINLITNEDNKFMESLSVIDSGYVDILVKVGYVGMFLYLFSWLKIITPILRKPKKHQLIQLAMAAYILQYFIINYTWSVFTYSHGLIPGFFAIYFIFESDFVPLKYIQKSPITRDVPNNTIVFGQNQFANKKITIPKEGGSFNLIIEK